MPLGKSPISAGLPNSRRRLTTSVRESRPLPRTSASSQPSEPAQPLARRAFPQPHPRGRALFSDAPRSMKKIKDQEVEAAQRFRCRVGVDRAANDGRKSFVERIRECDLLGTNIGGNCVWAEHNHDRVGFDDQFLDAFPPFLKGINFSTIDQCCKTASPQRHLQVVGKCHVHAGIGDEDFGLRLSYARRVTPIGHLLQPVSRVRVIARLIVGTMASAVWASAQMWCGTRAYHGCSRVQVWRMLYGQSHWQHEFVQPADRRDSGSSRNGASASANSSSVGALREHGRFAGVQQRKTPARDRTPWLG
jgi:hypothetical protein